jgi:hypothetical protein
MDAETNPSQNPVFDAPEAHAAGGRRYDGGWARASFQEARKEGFPASTLSSLKSSKGVN